MLSGSQSQASSLPPPLHPGGACSCIGGAHPTTSSNFLIKRPSVAELVGGTRFRVIRTLGLGKLLHGPSGRTVRLADLTPGS